jgi:hypothetical protein
MPELLEAILLNLSQQDVLVNAVHMAYDHKFLSCLTTALILYFYTSVLSS